MIRHISRKLKERQEIIKYSAAVILILIILVVYMTSPSKNFPTNSTFSISKSSGLKSVAHELKNQGYIRSSELFMLYAIVFGGTKSIKAGEYKMNDKDSSLTLAWRMNHGDYGFKKVKITIPEGKNHFELANIISKTFPRLDKQKISDLSSKYEGYLYPETYFWPENIDEKTIIDDMNSLFLAKTKDLKNEAEMEGLDFDNVIKLASLVEKEASKSNDRKLISGILLNRLAINMPLQVDVTFYFIDPDRDSKILIKDTKIDSPYNLYQNRGLPPTPICNPGLETIRDVIQPTNSKYLFYLADTEGNVHYATTLEEHNLNKARYLSR